MNAAKREEMINRLRLMIRAELPDHMDYALVLEDLEEKEIATLSSLPKIQQGRLFLCGALLPLLRQPDGAKVYPVPTKGTMI